CCGSSPAALPPSPSRIPKGGGEGLRRVIARAEARPRLRGRPEGRGCTSVLQDMLGPRAPFRASNQSTSALFRGYFGTLPAGYHSPRAHGGAGVRGAGV